MNIENIVTIKTTPALLEMDFEKFSAYVDEKLKEFDIVVTEDTIKDAKTEAANLNKVKKQLDDIRKQKVAEVSKPIKEFDAKCKTLVQKCTEARENITIQIDKFESKKRSDCLSLILDFQKEIIQELGIDNDYQEFEVKDLVSVAGVTAGGALIGRIKKEILNRAKDRKAYQDKIAFRCLELQNECYKAGLKTPLTEQHVQGFIHDEDESYKAKLKNLISSELNREAALRKAILKESEEQKAEEKPVSSVEENIKNEVSITPEVYSEDDIKKVVEKVESAKESINHNTHIKYSVLCEFEPTLPAHISIEKIEKELRSKLEKINIKTLKNISITPIIP